jgi:phosphohistidine phosphatase
MMLRHGIAVDRTDPRCPADPDRPLTPEGVAKTRAAARGLRAIEAHPDRIFTSPYVRARQTAEIVAEVLGAPRPVTCDALLPGADPSEMVAFLRRAADVREVLCAGPEPSLSFLLARLALGHAEGPVFAPLKKAGAALVATDLAEDCAGEMIWLLPPRLLRTLGGAS